MPQQPSEFDVAIPKEQADQMLRQISAQLASLSRVVRRVLDLDESDGIDKELLVIFRDAFAYAVKMKGREAETEELLQWVRVEKAKGSQRKAQLLEHTRSILAAVAGVIGGEIFIHYSGWH